jgi:methylenetetrahydrofolate dehydrogenase (NADP+)/methenyltetrahydrofolate cyclohydrolase
MNQSVIIDGKLLAEQLKKEIAAEVIKMIDMGLDPPHLAAILVGEDPASQTYVNNKEKSCKEVGFTSSIYRLDENVGEKKLLEVIDFLNEDDEVNGFIVQLPLPDNITIDKVLERIKPSKDVDGFHPINIGRMVLDLPCYLPATPNGIMQIIEKFKIETEGKSCVVLGRSNIVGTPVSILMSRKSKYGNATVTLCHSKTRGLKEICANADILIAAIGQPHFVTAEMVKEGAVVIDVGIHRIPDETKKSGFRLIGDVDFENVSKKAGMITPVPGGVGLLTIVSLLQNTLKAAKKEIYK